MTTGSRFSLAAILIGLTFGLLSVVSASDGSGQVMFDNSQIVSEAGHYKDFDEILSLRLRMNERNEVQLLNKCVVRGVWENSRIIPVGTRLYYEVLDHSGNVVAKGFRKDPRSMHGGKNVDFLLTAPYNMDCASVNLYVVDYENGGRGGYSRDYALLGTFDIRQTQTARLD